MRALWHESRAAFFRLVLGVVGGGLLGLFLLVVAILGLIEGEITGGVITLLLALIGGLGLVIWGAAASVKVLMPGRRDAAERALLKNGSPASAGVLSVARAEDNDALRLRFDDGTEIGTATLMPDSAVEHVRPGAVLQVVTDPARAQAAVDWQLTLNPIAIAGPDGEAITLPPASEARAAVIAAARGHGLSLADGLDFGRHPEARAAVVEALRKHGLNTP